MADTTVIGRGAFVRGRINGSGDLEIQGRVEGDVTVSGEVSIESSGLVGADISARRIVVRGAVKGNLTADDLVSIESGAKVVGDLKAPRIVIASGGLVRGQVQTGAAGASRPRAATTTAHRPATTAKPVAKPVERAAPPPPTKTQPAKVTSSKANGPAHAAARIGPPAPVVPVLKKGTKAIQKKAR